MVQVFYIVDWAGVEVAGFNHPFFFFKSIKYLLINNILYYRLRKGTFHTLIILLLLFIDIIWTLRPRFTRD